MPAPIIAVEGMTLLLLSYDNQRCWLSMCIRLFVYYMSCPILFPQKRASQHFFRTLLRELGDIPSHDVRDFAYTLIWAQLVDYREGAVVQYLFIYIVVGIRKCGNLGQMCDT